MRASNWKDYELLDTSAGERLERWGDIILIRPDPQIIWDTPKRRMLGIIVPTPAAVSGKSTRMCRICGKSAIRV